MCLADKGSGLPCPQKLSALKELSSEFGQAGKDKVDSIKSVGSQVINIVSNLESQQVEEQVSSHLKINKLQNVTMTNVLALVTSPTN